MALRRATGRRLLHRGLVILLSIYLVAPFVWMVVYSVYPTQNLRATPMDFNPADLTLSNYARLLSDGSFVTPMMNSLVVALATTVICMLIGSLCAYVLARFRFRGS